MKLLCKIITRILQDVMFLLTFDTKKKKKENETLIFTKFLSHTLVMKINKRITPSVLKYKQILLFRFIQLMMYVVHNMNHIHH